MIRFRTLFKIIALTGIGFVIPVAMLLPVEYALSEFGTQPDWNTLVDRYLPPATGCSLFFLASAITSSTPRMLVTFVQSLFLHGTNFILCSLAFVPIHHNKVADPQQGHLAWIPFVSVLLLFMALLVIGNIPITTKRKEPNPIANGDPDQYHA
jgi:Zn-dependent protease